MRAVMHKYMYAKPIHNEGMVSYQHHFVNKLTTMLLVVVKARVTLTPESVLHYSISCPIRQVQSHK